MPIEDWNNKPLPDGHPFKGTQIVFGQRRPDSSATHSPSGDSTAELEADGVKAAALQHQNEQVRKLTTEEKD